MIASLVKFPWQEKYDPRGLLAATFQIIYLISVFNFPRPTDRPTHLLHMRFSRKRNTALLVVALSVTRRLC